MGTEKVEKLLWTLQTGLGQKMCPHLAGGYVCRVRVVWRHRVFGGTASYFYKHGLVCLRRCQAHQSMLTKHWEFCCSSLVAFSLSPGVPLQNTRYLFVFSSYGSFFSPNSQVLRFVELYTSRTRFTNSGVVLWVMRAGLFPKLLVAAPSSLFCTGKASDQH